VEAEDPGLPSFPDTIETVSISVRTGDEEYDGTDDNTLSLCLSETTCFPLNMADVDDFRLGETDVYHFEGLWLPRSSVDRVELRSSSGADRWTPSCIDLRFDGEPVHCSQLQGLHFG